MTMLAPKHWQFPPGRLEEGFEDKKPLYDEAEAMAEATRCLYCSDAPCIQACPTTIDIPTFIRKIGTGNLKGAARTILSANLLGQSCGQVCPVEVLCAGACVYKAWGREPIAIGRLQRYAVETTLAQGPTLFQARSSTGKRVALVGSGPASITAAGLLALEGHTCTLFERQALPGGLDSLGIAPYKLKGPEALRELEWVLSLGRIELRTGVEVVERASGPGQVTAAELLESHDAVFLGLGLGVDSHLGIPGEAGEGVHGALHLIERIKAEPGLRLEGVRRAAVVGGGNTALDMAHELALLGVKVTLVYRRSEEEMSGYAQELAGARLDGVRLLENRQPLEVLRQEGKVVAVRLLATNRDGKPLPDTEELLTDLVAVAIGQERAPRVSLAFPGVELDAQGRVKVEPLTHRTGNPKVWSGGDCVNGGKEVVNAVAEARLAVQSMHRYLMGE